MGTVSVLSSPNVTTSFVGNLGTIQISGLEVNPGESDDFAFTMPTGITLDTGQPEGAVVTVPEYNPGTTVQNAFWPGPSVSADVYVSRFKIGTSSISFEITAAAASPSFSGTGSFLVNVPVVSVAGAPPGPVDITVWDTDNLIPHEVVGSGTLLNNPGEQLEITNSNLPTGTVGVPYSASVSTNSGGYPPYTYSVTAGQLPPGLTLAAATGTVSGTPSAAGTYTVTITVKDNTVYSASQNYNLTVNPAVTSGSSAASTQPAGHGAVAFSDIANSWAAPYIIKLAEAGVVSGYPDGTFRPDQTVTRVQFAKMLLLAMGKKPSSDYAVLAGFSDYGTYAGWELPWLAAAVQEHMLAGYPDGTLRPDDTVTWLEAAVMMGKTIGGAASGEPNFPGAATIPAWAQPYVAKDYAQAQAKGLFSRLTAAFDTEQPLTRAQAAAVLAIYMGL